MHLPSQPEPRPPNGSESRRSSVVPLNPTEVPARLDDVPTVLGKNPDAVKSPAEAFGLAPGSRLSHFEIIGPIGAGGMASVFKAHDLSLSREVALKILPPDFARDPDAVTRFKQEARAAAQLNHENIARVFFTGEEHGLYFIAFEFVEGETLREVIDRLGTVPPGECVRYMLDVAAGLQHASERGVIHRDVKPSNILITPAGRAKLIDMGLARSRELTPVNGGVTQSGTTLGTFDYISPEQAIDPRTADVRSDIYSLGCTCYHALTGRPPVPDGNAARKLAAHQGEAPVDPRLINQAVTDELADVLDRMMAKNPIHRYQSAAELIADLARVGRTLGVTTEGVELASALGANARQVGPPTTTRTTSIALAAGGIAVAIAVVVALGVWSRSSNPLPPPWADTPRTTPAVETASGEPVPEVRPIAKSLEVANTDEMRQAIKAGVPKLILTAGVEYDLTTADGMVLGGKAIEWVCPADPKAATVRVMSGPTADRGDDPRPGTLTFSRCESVRLSGIRFEILQPFDDPTAEPIGVMFTDVGRVELAESAFEPGGATVTTDGSGLTLTRCGSLTARHCYFGLKSWTTVELVGTQTAAFTECGFVTSRTGVEVTSGMALPDRTAIALKHTTFLLQGGASAVTVNREAKCDLTAGFSLFAAPPPDTTRMMTTELDRKPVIVRGDQGEATFTVPNGQPNAVYLVTPPPTLSGLSPEQLKTSPWANARADADKPWAVFELNPKLKGLRTSVAGILGVRTLPTERHRIYDDWPLPALFPLGVKVWHPNATPAEREDLPPNVFTELAQAVNALVGKDELHVRGSGRIEVPTAVVLNVPKRTVVVRAEKGSSPILVPTEPGRKDAAVFRLEAGELTLDGLGFLIQPIDTDGTTAVVSVSGGKRCDLRNCVVTLDEDADERAAAVSVADVSDQMKSDTPARPSIGFENCLVRGRGRLIRAGASVPLDVTVSNVGAAVSGPLFEFGIPTRLPRGTSGVSLQLTQVTAVLGGSLLDVRGTHRASDEKSMVVPVDVRADGCLFVTLEAGTHPLISVSGIDPTGTDRYLTWTPGTLGNAFSGWDVFAEWPASDGTTDPQRWNATEWRKWSGERETAIGRATLNKLPTAKGLSAVRSTDLGTTINPFDDRIGTKLMLLPNWDN